MDNTAGDRKRPIEGLLFLTLVFAFAFFYHPALFDNSLTRLDLTHSIVLHSNINIDAYHFNTIDKAHAGGHFYCDKAPGVSFAAAPVLAALRFLLRSATFDPANPLIAYILTFLTISIPAALAYLLLFRIIRALTGSDASAFILTIFSALGTISFTYATQFYGHQFAASALIAALYLIVYPQLSRGSRPGARALAAAGLLMGVAVISDYPAAVVCAAVAPLAMLREDRFRNVALIAAGAAPAVLALALYNNAAFGGPFAIGYFKEVTPMFSEGMSKGLGGVTYPQPSALLKLLLSPQRGLFFGSPFLLFAIAGIAYSFKTKDMRKTVVLSCAAAFLLTLLVNASYYEPYGGFAPGPRFLAIGLPFLCIAAAASWPYIGSPGRIVLAGFGLFSIVNNTFINAAGPHVPHIFSAPAAQYSYYLISKGFASAGLLSIIGIRGAALLPVFFIVLAVLTIPAIGKAQPVRKTAMYLCSSLIIASALGAVLYATGRNIDKENSGVALYYYAAAFESVEQHDKALKEIDASVRLSPRLSEAWMLRGMICMKLGAKDEVERSFYSAIESDPRDAQPYVSLAAFQLIYKNDPAAALDTISKGNADIRPKNDPRISLLREIERDAKAAIEKPNGGSGR